MRVSNSLWTVGALLSGVTNSVQNAIPDAHLAVRDESIPPPQTVTIPGSVTTVTGVTLTQTVTTLIFATPVVTTNVIPLPPFPVPLPGSTTVVQPISKVTLCPQPTGIQENLRTNLTKTTNRNSLFGCKRGLVCNPPKPEGCNLWPGSPPPGFTCAPEDCIPAPETRDSQFWIGDNFNYYSPAWGYFNLDPEPFGLTYKIFQYSSDDKTKRRTNGGRVDRKRQYIRTPPAACYGPCDAAWTRIQVGEWVPEEDCGPESETRILNLACRECFTGPLFNTTKPDAVRYLDQKFFDFESLCNGTTPVTPSSSSTGPDPAGPSSAVDTTSGGTPASSTFTALPGTVANTTTSSELSTSPPSTPAISSTQLPPVTLSNTTSIVTTSSSSSEPLPTPSSGPPSFLTPSSTPGASSSIFVPPTPLPSPTPGIIPPISAGSHLTGATLLTVILSFLAFALFA